MSRPRYFLLLGASGFDRDFDVDFFADQDAAGFECLIPGEAEIFAVDARRRFECEFVVAPWIFAGYCALRGEFNLFGRSANCKVAGYVERRVARLLNAGASEFQCGVVCSVEEIRGT